MRKLSQVILGEETLTPQKVSAIIVLETDIFFPPPAATRQVESLSQGKSISFSSESRIQDQDLSKIDELIENSSAGENSLKNKGFCRNLTKTGVSFAGSDYKDLELNSPGDKILLDSA